MKILISCLCLSILCLVVESKIGRGGGGGSFRSLGSRVNRIKPPPPRPGPSYGGYNSYNRGGGIRWGSFGAGMAAYGIMSSLSRAGHYHPGYYSRPEYYRESRHRGSLCVNNEDFNGTKFGSFYCPLPGFNPSATYCCGESDAQYCCEYFDDESRKNGIIIAGICAIGIFICIIACIIRVYLIFKKKNNFPKSPSVYTAHPNIHHVNRNYAQMPRAPIIRQTQYQNNYQPNTPYPTTPLMPQPTDTKYMENMPPSYTDAKKTNSVKNRSNAAPNNIVHMNFPMSNTDAPFYVNNNEIVELPLGSNTGSNLNPNSENFGWRQEVLPNAPVNNDMNQPPPPYSSVVNNN
ncbi:unnamed protein product [Brachionus calyciflorus]|uniref:Shisa N-terminal domain-containing protein n=1 Tax=Brachionus calyciflorus TaxID=104777 RepID=A0A813ZJK3_9BILA|nr:unnamed protein product [Brachionus calyciflorus]